MSLPEDVVVRMDVAQALEKALRTLLSEIRRNPSSYPPPGAMADVVRKVRAPILDRLRKSAPQEGASVDDLFFPLYEKGIVSAYWYLTRELGLEEEEALELTRAAMEIAIGITPTIPLSDADRVLAEELAEIIDSGGTFYALEYASELGLVYFDGEGWRVSALSDLLLRLPPHEFVKALLTLECLMSKGNPYCMTMDFLEKLANLFSKDKVHKMDFISSRTGYVPFLTREWLSRLESLGLVRPSFNRVEVTRLGEIITREVLDPQNLYARLFEDMIRKEAPPLVIGDVKPYLEQFKDDPLLKPRWREVEEALSSYGRGDYVSALRTLLPVIEHALREIATKEGMGGAGKGLKGLAGILVGSKWLSERTEGLIKALGRDVDLHGLESPDPDKAPFYAQLAFITLLEVIRDYRRHKLLRKALERIAPEVGAKPEQLLRAYPNDRSAIHVQLLSDKHVRITVNEKDVFEAEEVDGKLEVRRLSE
jgi:hypothetical protein